MKTVLLLVVFLGFSGQTFAQDLSPSATSIKLLGRGIYNPKTHESIALACNNETCSELRFVLFTQQKMEPLGAPIKVPVYVGEETGRKKRKLLSKALTVQIENYLMLRTSDSRAKEIHAYGRANKIVLMVGAPFFFVSYWMGFGAMVTLAVGEQLFEYLKPGSIVGTLGTGYSSVTLSQDAKDQDGWNWSDHPSRRSAKVFNRVLEALRNQPAADLNEYIGDIRLRKFKLYYKGIRFHDGAHLYDSRIGGRSKPAVVDR